MRFAYCTGIRRCACSTNTTAATTRIPTAQTKRNANKPFCNLIDQSWPGKPAAIDVKIKIDIPLPTPRSVMSSPSHMITEVPAVITITIVKIRLHDASGMIGVEHPEIKRPGVRATAINPVDCKIAKPIVK